MEQNNEYLQQETYGAAYAYPREVMLQFGRAAIMIIAGDGEVSDAEWRYISGRARAMGVPMDIINSWKFDHHKANLEVEVKAYWDLLGGPGYSFIYEAIKAASADGYADGERRAVRQAAAICGVSEAIVRQIENLVEIEEATRKMRITLLYPDPSLFHDPAQFHKSY